MKNKKSKKKTSASNNKKVREGLPMGNEVIVLVSLGIMLLMMLSNFNLCGAVGVGLSSVFFGIFGCIQYVMPLVIFGSMLFLAVNDYNGLAVRKCAALYILLLVIAAFAGLMSKEEADFSQLFALGIKDHATGGMLGGGLALALKGGFGQAGAIVILICVAMIALVMLTQRSFIEFSQKVSAVIGDFVHNQKEAVTAARMERQKEEMGRRQAQEDQEVASGQKDTARKPRRRERIKTRKVDEKVRQIRESMEDKRRKESSLEKESTGPDVHVPLFTSSDEVKKRDAVQELHPEIRPLSPEEGKTQPLNQELDFSAFSYQDGRQDALTFVDSMPEFARTLEELKENKKAQIPPDKQEGGFVEDPGEDLSEPAYIADPEEEAVDSLVVDEQVSVDEESQVQEVERKPIDPDSIRVNRAKPLKPADRVEPASGKDYIFPPLNLLTKSDVDLPDDFDRSLKETAVKLQETLDSFGVHVTITDISCGPAVTRYEFYPEQGTKVSKILSLTDDIKLNLAAQDVRIEAPIPGKAAIGIEVPNKIVQTVHLRETIDNRLFQNSKSNLTVAIGKDIGGKIIVTDLAKMPHLLIAGATGSGKSVCINSLIMSILYKARPDEVKLIMIDPKMVELSMYNGIPHLLIPVVTDPKKASGALSWAVAEMNDRYRKFSETGVRNITGYNRKVEEVLKRKDSNPENLEKMPKIVIIIDELADLMMVAAGEVEDAIVRLAQLARAAGIHLVIATQRPSVNVITGLIKANIPSRIALSVSSGVDSRTIIDMYGAEKLLGNGDMLFYPAGYQKPVRVQGVFITDEEINEVVEFLRDNEKVVTYDDSVEEKIESRAVVSNVAAEHDEYFEAAARFIMEKDKATIGMLQRMFKIGFNRAARIMDQLAEAGIVGPEEGTKPRKILMSPEELDAYFEEYSF